MKRVAVMIVLCSSLLCAEEGKKESTGNLRQYYSGKFGFYQPSDGLNNGLLFGIDGITEFVHYDFVLAGSIDFYQKQTFNIFKDPKPDVKTQAIVLLPMHANVGLRIFNAADADSRGYLGIGGGYYLFFYSLEYSESSGGGFPLPQSLTTHTESKSRGNIFGTAFLRILVGKIFLEPRMYFAFTREESIGGRYSYIVNPSGFAITLGFQND